MKDHLFSRISAVLILTIGFTIVMSGVAKAIPCSATITCNFEESDVAFTLKASGGPITVFDEDGIAHGQIAVHTIDVGQKWRVQMHITEDPAGDLWDTVAVNLSQEPSLPAFAQHIIGVPGHPGETGNPNRFEFGLFIISSAVKPLPFDSKSGSVPHPPLTDHIDDFSARLSGTFGGFGFIPFSGFGFRTIDSYELVITGSHCSSACPVPPDIPDITEPTTLLLFGTTLSGLGIATRWRHRRWN
jgi:hypothetical protein